MVLANKELKNSLLAPINPKIFIMTLCKFLFPRLKSLKFKFGIEFL